MFAKKDILQTSHKNITNLHCIVYCQYKIQHYITLSYPNFSYTQLCYYSNAKKSVTNCS